MAITRTSALNRKQRKELARRLQSADPGLEVMHPNAAGIDVGNSTTTSPYGLIAMPTPCGFSASRLTSIASSVGCPSKISRRGPISKDDVGRSSTLHLNSVARTDQSHFG
jgi:hypothetical protein